MVELDANLTPNAQAFIDTIQHFQYSQDSDTVRGQHMRLQEIVQNYRGNLHDAVINRLKEVLKPGGVQLVTERDIWSIVTEIMGENASILREPELQVLSVAVQKPSISMKQISEEISNLSYNQVRRAMSRLRETGIYAVRGLLNASKLGLQRYLIVLESPNLIPSSPYFHKFLFTASAQKVFIVATIPKQKESDFLNMVRSLRTDARSVTAYKLSRGTLHFSPSYYSKDKRSWEIEPLHFGMLLRQGGQELVFGESRRNVGDNEVTLANSEPKILQVLLQYYDMAVSEISSRTGLSETTVVDTRLRLLNERVVLPRPRLRIPTLREMLIFHMSDAAGDLLAASRYLPLTYISRIENLETSEQRILLLSFCKKGSTAEMKNLALRATSLVDNVVVHRLQSGISDCVSVETMYDVKKGAWAWDNNFFDAVGYRTLRRSASPEDIPLDLTW
ncbi:MAG: hypothetical protein ACOC38_07690 [Promethearchaeia archaeon]